MLKFPEELFEKYPEMEVLRRLDTPHKIQGYLDRLKMNFEKNHQTQRSPLMAIRRGEAHCVEGAMIAAAALWCHGEPPLVMELMTTPVDFGHIVTLFKRGNRWGAMSKTNHAVLQYRDPVYRDQRELAMSYFNEYFRNTGAKTLRSYSVPVNMTRFGTEWLTARRNLWEVTDTIDGVKHVSIIRKQYEKHLRPAQPLEIEAGKIVAWRPPARRGKRG